MNKRSLPIPVILAISHEITQYLESFSLKITKIVIHGVCPSCKWRIVKSHSRSIDINFDHDLSPKSIDFGQVETTV